MASNGSMEAMARMIREARLLSSESVELSGNSEKRCQSDCDYGARNDRLQRSGVAAAMGWQETHP